MKITEEMVDLAETVYDNSTEASYEFCRREYLRAALEAALASIPDPEPLSERDRDCIEYARSFCKGNSFGEDAIRALLVILDQRFPKPQRTPAELCAILSKEHVWSDCAMDAILELVALAEKNK